MSNSKLSVVIREIIMDSDNSINDHVTVNDYFRRMRAPDDMEFIDQVCATMNSIINYLRLIGDEYSDDTLTIWEDINGWVINNRSRLSKLGVRLYANNKVDQKTLRGKNQSHPLYCVIWTGSHINTCEQNYICLKSIFFMVWPLLENITQTENGINSNYLYNIARTIRALGEEGYKQHLMRLPAKPLNLNDYVKFIFSIRKIKTLSSVLEDIYKYLRIADGSYCFVTRDGNKRSDHLKGGSTHRGVPPRELQLICAGTWDVIDDPDYEKGIIYVPVTQQGLLRDSNKDLTIDDYCPPFSVVEMVPRGDDYLKRDYRQEALNIKARNNSIAMSNQLLPNDRGSLSLYDTGSIASWIDKRLRDYDTQKYEEFVYSIVLTMCLVYGFDIEDILTTNVLNREISSLDNGCAFGYIRNIKMIGVNVHSMTKNVALSDKAKLQSIPVKSYLLLGVPQILTNAIEQLISFHKPEKRSNYKLFDLDPSVCTNAVNRIIRITTDSRFTHATLKRTIFTDLVSHCDDIADAMLITANEKLFSTTRLHYTTRPRSSLEAIHHNMFKSLISEVSYEFEWGNDALSAWELSTLPTIQGGFVGASLTPTRAAVKNMIQSLTKLLKNSKKEFNWIYFHNIYTAYTLLMFDFCTGSRAVNRQFSLSFTINTERGVAIMSDKEHGDFYNTRTVPITPLCLEQWRLYKKHLDVVLMNITQMHNKTSRHILSSMEKTPTRWNEPALREFANNNIGNFFFIDDNLRPSKEIPKQIKSIINEFWNLPLNTNRHYLRSNLRELGISGELIDGTLGHWQYGEEPYGRFSTLIPDELNKIVKNAVGNIMQEDGWVTIRGLHSAF
ncbi:MAG: hypothetical protein OQK54_00570 [Gammaproteobacteria bacterium]|nr:hypothetical protein [Gammaproteobacteria bacterium]